ncbi:ATP-binding protein [Magnetospirillum sp. SS-4]|uniref:ATP-binding protein n=1 Tax=Magnetospirillum sp. SS-4 TaxID=2681465 RepID=UPI002738DCA0|nr:ATP-binding protein [Magnetospirillum sp. SS-4]
MSELKLYGMRASFDEIAGKGLVRRDEIYPLLASLIRAERVHRQAKSISYRMRCAKFPVLKDLDSFVFAETPVDQGLVRELATGAFLDAKRNASLARPARASKRFWPRYVTSWSRISASHSAWVREAAAGLASISLNPLAQPCRPRAWRVSSVGWDSIVVLLSDSNRRHG